jgi:hypothetical protein
MLERGGSSRRISKTNAVTSMLDYDLAPATCVGPSD